MVNYRKEAKGRPCMVNISGVCNHDTQTTVLAHLNVQGLNVKAHDLHGCWACSACHEWLDHGWAEAPFSHPMVTREQRDYEHYKAIIRTQQQLIREGKL